MLVVSDGSVISLWLCAFLCAYRGHVLAIVVYLGITRWCLPYMFAAVVYMFRLATNLVGYGFFYVGDRMQCMYR